MRDRARVVLRRDPVRWPGDITIFEYFQLKANHQDTKYPSDSAIRNGFVESLNVSMKVKTAVQKVTTNVVSASLGARPNIYVLNGAVSQAHFSIGSYNGSLTVHRQAI